MLAIVIRLLGYRKETERVKKKGLRILAAAAVLTFGCLTMNAYAAEGWALSNNIWTYLDKNGNRVTNEWKKGADNLWRYLNNSGEMAVNSWADNDYYVDANGIMVANKWMQIASPYSRDSQTYWFYFGSSGKVTKDSWKKIDGRNYLFDSEGVMQTGWLDLGGKKYYLDASGAMYAGVTFEMDGNTWQAAADGSCTVVLPEENAAGNGGSTDGQTPTTGSQSPVQPSGPAGV